MRIVAEISETTRKIKLPIDRVLSVNGDYQVDEIAFKLPDTYEGDFDFRTGVTRVHWKGADGAEHAEVLVSVDSSGRPLWVLPAALTQGGDGVIEFSVSFSTTDESDHLTQRWKTKPAAFRNERGIGGNDEQAEDDEIYDRLASAVASVRAAQAEVEDTNAVLSSLTGSAPVPVENRSDMVDNGHLYLYTGDENGFVTGNLYYYVNGTLTNGGPYGAVTLDDTLSQSGQAADAAAVGEALDDIDADVAQIKEDLLTKTGLSEEAKQALLACFANVAWTDDHGQDYYDALEGALYPLFTLVSISAVYTQSDTVYNTDSLDVLKTDLVVTAHYSNETSGVVTGYTLLGTLTRGTSTITVSYGGKTATFNVTVTADTNIQLKDGTFIFSDGTTIEVNHNHITATCGSAGSARYVNLSNLSSNTSDATSTNNMDNLSSTFVALGSNDNITVSASNFPSEMSLSGGQKNVSINIRKQGTSTNILSTSLQLGKQGTNAWKVSDSQTEPISSDVVGSCLFMYVGGSYASRTFEFDVSIAVE